jgi:hypothetical protein
VYQHPQKIASLLLPLLLSGCFQTHLNGVVAGSEISVSTLENPSRPIHALVATDDSTLVTWKGQDSWNKLAPGKRLAWMGLFFLPGNKLQTEDYYLVTARGGINRDPALENKYAEQGLPVRGSWHAVLPAEYVGEKNNQVSLLTEVCYQWLNSRREGRPMSSPQISQALDFAASRLAGDVNQDSSVDYLDILSWNMYRDMKHFKGDPQLLNRLNMAVTLDFPQPEIQRLSLQLLGEPAGGPPQSLASFLAYRLQAAFQ